MESSLLAWKIGQRFRLIRVGWCEIEMACFLSLTIQNQA